MPDTEFDQISAHSGIFDASVLSIEHETSDKQKIQITEENPEMIENFKNQPGFDFKKCFFVLIIGTIFVVLIVFASIGINHLVSNQKQEHGVRVKQPSIIKSQEVNSTKLSQEETERAKEIKDKNNQIFKLKIQVADLEYQIIKLRAQLEKQRLKTKSMENGTYVAPSPDNQPNQSQDSSENPILNKNQLNPINPTQNQTKNEQTTKNQTQTPKQETQKEEQNKPTFTVRQAPRKRTPTINTGFDRYQFTAPIDQIVEHSPIDWLFPSPNITWFDIKRTEYERAIRLMQVTHNVNFKGQFVLDHYKYYETPQDKYESLKRILDQEKLFYERKYNLSKYIHDQIGICVYLPSFNNAKTRLYLRNLDSVFQQQYQNYHVVYVNDASTDATGDYVKFYMEDNGIPKEKYTLISNEKNKGNCHNIHMVAHNYCNPGEIMVLLDGDDALIGRQVFSLLNAVYQKQKVALTYGQFLTIQNNSVMSGSSREIPQAHLRAGAFRMLRQFYTSHLKTMYVDVMRAIKESDLQYPNGTFFDYASDVAYMTAAVELVGTRLKFLKQLNYEYRFDTGLNEPQMQQIVVEYQVYDKEPSKKLEDMSFADNPKTVHYP